MVRWCGLELRPAGECGSEWVCLSKEKRNNRESQPKERREVGENEWWGVGLGGAHMVYTKMLTLHFFFLLFSF